MRGALFALPTFATAQFKRFLDCGPAVRCMLPLGLGRFMLFVVLYGSQGADTDAEQLALTEQCCCSRATLLTDWLGISTWSPPKSLAWLAKGISAGLWVFVGGGLGFS